MAYVINIPDATSVPSQIQAQMKANCNAIPTVVAVNHVAFDASGQGKHKFLQMPEQAAAPASAANEAAFYAAEGTVSGVTELVFRRESSGTEIEMTARGGTTTGWTMLPSGLLVKWGVSGAATAAATITWPVGATIPVFSAVYNVSINFLEATVGDIDVASPRLISFSTTQVKAYLSKRLSAGDSTVPVTLYFVAIGIPV